MTRGLKKKWQKFQSGRPGHRFQDRYERNRQARSNRTLVKRFIKPLAGIGMLVAGVVFCLIPGPGLPLLLFGGGLLADVSRPAARAMDWLDVRIRAVISRSLHRWKQASTGAKYAVIVLAVFVGSGAGYSGFRILMQHLNGQY
jgi:hypothetical protein